MLGLLQGEVELPSRRVVLLEVRMRERIAPMSNAAIEERVDELLARMTLEEKVGLMFHAPIFMNPDGTLLDGTEERIAGRHLNHFNIYSAPGPRHHAEWHNRLQDLAKMTRLGIP